MIVNNLKLRVDRVTYLKRSDISADPATQILLRHTMRGVDMKKINVSTPSHPDTFTLVDDTDHKWLNQWKWTASQGTASLYVQRQSHKGKRIFMHRFILKTPKGEITDHINHNGLDNRRCNIRIATKMQNNLNRKPRKDKYKGVSRGGEPRKKKWQARIVVNKKSISLGYYATPKEAAKAYDKAALEYFGEFACINFALEE